MDAPPAPRPVNCVPVSSALTLRWWSFPGPGRRAAGLSKPVITWMSSRNEASGERHGLSSKPLPVSVGIQYFSTIPLPLNHSTNRVSTGVSSLPAQAVPFELNMAASAGRPTRIGTAAAVSPLRNRRRDTEDDFVCTLLIAVSLPLAPGIRYGL